MYRVKSVLDRTSLDPKIRERPLRDQEPLLDENGRLTVVLTDIGSVAFMSIPSESVGLLLGIANDIGELATTEGPSESLRMLLEAEILQRAKEALAPLALADLGEPLLGPRHPVD